MRLESKIINNNSINQLVQLLLLFCFIISCKKEKPQIEVQQQVESKAVKVIDSSALVTNKSAQEITVKQLSQVIDKYGRQNLDIFFPVTKAYKYTNNDVEYFALLTEDLAIQNKQDTINTRINFYLLHKEKQDFSIQHKLSKNHNYNYFKNAQVAFLKKHMSFHDIDNDGTIDPIVVTKSNEKLHLQELAIYIYQQNKVIPIINYQGEDYNNGTYISPYFHTLPKEIKNHVASIMQELEMTGVYNSKEILKEKWHYFTPEKMLKAHANDEQKNTDSINLVTTGYTLEKIKNAYEAAFPTSKKVTLDFPLDASLDLHSGVIENNLETAILLPDFELEYIYVSQDNSVFKQLIYKNEFFLLQPREQEPIDDNNINYTIYSGGYAIPNSDYQNGWESEYTPLFPDNMPENKYVAFARLKYFDGKKQQILYSPKEILTYCKSKCVAVNGEDFEALKMKYDTLYPISKKIKVNTGIYFVKRGPDLLTQYGYVPELINFSNTSIDLRNSTFRFYFVNNKEQKYTLEIENAFNTTYDPEQGDILGDSHMINYTNDFWLIDNRIMSTPFPNNLPYGNYLIYSEIETIDGEIFYSEKEFIQYYEPKYKNQKLDTLHNGVKEFYNDLNTITQDVNANKIEKEYNCFTYKKNNKSYFDCYFPKHFNSIQMYELNRVSDYNLNNELLPHMPKKDTSYFSKNYMKVSYKLNKSKSDTLNITIENDDYIKNILLYTNKDYPVVSNTFTRK